MREGGHSAEKWRYPRWVRMGDGSDPRRDSDPRGSSLARGSGSCCGLAASPARLAQCILGRQGEERVVRRRRRGWYKLGFVLLSIPANVPMWAAGQALPALWEQTGDLGSQCWWWLTGVTLGKALPESPWEQGCAVGEEGGQLHRAHGTLRCRCRLSESFFLCTDVSRWALALGCWRTERK